MGRIARRRLLAAACGVSAAVMAHAALAQETTTSVNEVVVTAQKRSQNVQDVPEQVSVVSSQFIDQLHATSLADISGYVPGLELASGGAPGETALGLRGVFPISSNVTVATYVDDTPVGGSSLYSNAAAFSLDLLPYDVANIQVLSGPQGTLYGATTLGGLLKYQLTQPNLHTFHAQVGGDIEGVEHGGDVGGGARFTLNGPIVDGQLAFIASYAYENTPGYVDNVQQGTTGVNGVRQQGARLGLLWVPTPKLRVELNALFQQVDADDLGEVALKAGSARPVAGELKNDNFVPQTFRKGIDVLSDRTTYDFGFADLTSVTSYQYTNSSQVEDATYAFSPVAVGGFGAPAQTLGPVATSLGQPTGIPVLLDQHIQLRKYTEEIRLASKPNPHFEWLLGAYVTYEHSSLDQDLSVANLNGSRRATYPLGGANVSSALETIALPAIYREYAGFGDFTWHLTPKLDISGGVRYSYNAQDFKQSTAFNVAPIPSVGVGHSNDTVVTFSASPSYKLSRDVNVYLRFASGYQPGGPNVLLAGVPPSVAADTLMQYEIGLKSQFLNRRGTLDVAAFYNEWDNIQVAELDEAAGTSFIGNNGSAKTEGFDATSSFVVIPGLTLGGTFNYTYAAFTSINPATAATFGAKVGSLLTQTPRFSGSVQVTWLRPLVADWNYGAGAALRLESSRISATNYFTPQQAPGAGLYYREPGFGALDLNASVSNARYTVRLYAKNITDQRSYNSFATINGPQIGGILIQPRTVGLSVDARF